MFGNTYPNNCQAEGIRINHDLNQYKTLELLPKVEETIQKMNSFLQGKGYLNYVVFNKVNFFDSKLMDMGDYIKK